MPPFQIIHHVRCHQPATSNFVKMLQFCNFCNFVKREIYPLFCKDPHCDYVFGHF